MSVPSLHSHGMQTVAYRMVLPGSERSAHICDRVAPLIAGGSVPSRLRAVPLLGQILASSLLGRASRPVLPTAGDFQRRLTL
jgi:hypothetical protein